MTTAENLALVGESHYSQFRPMLRRAESLSISEEYDNHEGCAMTDYIFTDGSKLRVCQGHMEAIN